jgi:HAD superfamily hydrolase (TIGR01509 family)
MRAVELDAVTIDAYGTLVALVDPVPALTDALAARGVQRPHHTIVNAFRTEVAYYGKHSAVGCDAAGLEILQRDCARVFLEALDTDLDSAEFAPVYAAAMHFDLLPGVVEALDRLRALGLELAVVANWDITIGRLLDEIDLAHRFRTIVHAAEKPAPDGLRRALAELGVDASRALHVGDDDVDEQAAAAAGTHFARAPLAAAIAGLT